MGFSINGRERKFLCDASSPLYNYIRQQGQIVCFSFLSCVYMCGMQVNVGVHMCVGECAPVCVFTCGDLRLRSRVLLTLHLTH